MTDTVRAEQAPSKAAYRKPLAVALSVQITESGTSGVDEAMMMGDNPTRKAAGS